MNMTEPEIELSPKVKIISEKDELDQLNFSKTAKWSFSRLQLGRKKADELIKAEKRTLLDILPPDATPDYSDISNKAVTAVFQQALGVELRDLQYIISEDTILNVATPRHSVVSPTEVGTTVIQVLQEAGYQIHDGWNQKYRGVLATSKHITSPFGDLKVGLGIHFGNITLQRCIRASVYFQIEICTNPLSFLELSNTMGTKIGLLQAKILRLGESENILTKVRAGVLQATKDFQVEGVPDIMVSNGKRDLPVKDATAIIRAMSTAYAISNKIQEEVISSYPNTPKTAWDLAMLFSKISIDGSMFRDTAIQAPAKLAAIGLVILTTTEFPKLVQNSYTYCHDNALAV